MLPQIATAFLAGILFPSSIGALPQQSNAAPNDIWHYSNDPACTNSACVADCRSAATAVCDQLDVLSPPTHINVTVNHCQAFYLWNLGNSVATKDSCYAAFTRINDAGAKGAGPNECGGTVGGALGFDQTGNRTTDPLYVLNPTDGNGNCFKAPGDNTPPIPVDQLANGEKLPMPDTCPSNTARRRRDALQLLEKRGSAGTIDCAVGDVMLLTGCTAQCSAWALATTWWYVFAGTYVSSRLCIVIWHVEHLNTDAISEAQGGRAQVVYLLT